MQLKQLLWKHSLLYWRNPGYSLARMVSSLVTALVFGLTFWQEGKLPDDEPVRLENVQNILGSLYAGLSFMGMTNLIMGVPAFAAERQVSYRCASLERPMHVPKPGCADTHKADVLPRSPNMCSQ